ncbi:MAG: 4-hydroxy-tetrahydrodipicolinate reductase [Zoogloeaceae bacterium]|jgi:4-hydroxy-tetrahydrodipicolinate reductase|nr:4-hydroxy-tetrahydrodipicolinate reductase [Zoogloeaceae bacterium]
MANELKVAVAGASGRMGKTLIEAALAAPDITLTAAFDRAGTPAIGQDAGSLAGLSACGVPVSDSAQAAIAQADCLIDFTRPEGTLEHLKYCVEHQVAMIIGTTGFDAAGKAAIEAAARCIPVVFAPNMAVGVNLVFALLKQAAPVLAQYDVEIVEAHHRLKVDAPSGTALRMGEVVAEATGRKLADCAIYGREGHTGVRDPQTIGFATVRGGDIVGDHTVMFCGPGERIEITHKAASRMPYAQGSLTAARFLRGKSCGLFDMQAVLGL